MNLSQTVQLTRLGKIRLGVRKPITKEGKNEKCRKANHPNDELCMYCSYPVQTDHFVFDGPEDYPPGIYEALIRSTARRASLQFYFPTENRALVFPQALKFYKGSGCGAGATGRPPAGSTTRTADVLDEVPCEFWDGARPGPPS
jgi:hypothetical protein